VLDELGEQLGGDFAVLCGSEGFEPSIRLDATHPQLTLVQNRFFLRRRLLWQSGALSLARAESVAMELNPRILSSWVLLVLRRVRRRRSVLWGHAWSRRGPGARSEPFRHAMRRLANVIVVYTETQKRELAERMPGATIVAAPNGLYPRSLAVTPSAGAAPQNIVYSGRLIAGKKPGLLVDAFLAAEDRLPEQIRLVIVGDGPLRAELERRASAAGTARVVFLGEVWGYEPLRAVYDTALCSASPGSVGLSLIQSLWFGVPAIIARDEPHAPEIEAVEERENAIVVDSDSVAAMRDAILHVAKDRDEWLARRPAIAASCVERYSVEPMVASIASAMIGDRGRPE
jgi:glycosyltransferase involved in cell wall biosynthesis